MAPLAGITDITQIRQRSTKASRAAFGDQAGYQPVVSLGLSPLATSKILMVGGVGSDQFSSTKAICVLSGDQAHPVCGYRARTGDWTTPLKASDFVTLAGFRRTAVYEAIYREELDHWFDFGLPVQPDRTRAFIFTRKGGSDFTERDRLVASVIQPHLEARAKDAEDAALAAAALATVEESAGFEPQAIVLCSARGIIEFASRRSRALLKRYFGLDNGRVPAGLLARERQTVSDDDGRLTVRMARTGTLRLLLLEEHDRRLERLTAREREVLDEVARGWTNAEIALHLGLASTTVRKHLEHVYEKLGVRTRTAAAALVARDQAPRS